MYIHILILPKCKVSRARIESSDNLRKAARRCWECMPANGQKRPPRGWSCRSSNRPREIDHLALLLHPFTPAALSSSAYHHPARFPPTLLFSLPHPPSFSLSLCRYPQFHYPPSCSLYYRTAAQASPYIVNMSGTSKRARAHPHERTHPHVRVDIGTRRCRGVLRGTREHYRPGNVPRRCVTWLNRPFPTPSPPFLPPLAGSNHPRPPSPHQPSRSLSACLPLAPTSSYPPRRRSLAAARQQLPAANMAAAN